AAGVRAARLHAVERGRVVRPVDARGDDDHALDAERPVERRHLRRERGLRRVDTAREERKPFGVTVDVRVAIAGAGRHLEAHAGGRLRGTACSLLCGHRRSGRDGVLLARSPTVSPWELAPTASALFTLSWRSQPPRSPPRRSFPTDG